MARRDIQSPRLSTSLTITTAGVSGILDQAGYRLGAITPSSGASTVDPLAFLGGPTTAALADLWTSTAQVLISSGSLSTGARSYTFVADFAAALAAHRYIQMRKGAAAASTQAGEQVVTVSLVPLRSP